MHINSIKTLKNNAIFFGIYTILFLFVFISFPYTSPFILGGLIAFIISPISKKLKSKFNIDTGMSTLVLSFAAVAVVITLATYLVIFMASHLMKFVNSIINNSDEINRFFIELTSNINIYVDQLQSVSNFNLENMISRYSTELINLLKSILSTMLSLATSIPYMIIFIIVLFASTYFIAKDLDKIENKFYNIFSISAKIKVKNIKKEIVYSVLGYLKAYTILISITFATISISFIIFKVKFAVLLGAIGAILDLLPIVGVVIIFVPIIFYYFIIGNYVSAIGLTFVFIGLTIIRQVLEPKLLSSSIGINPLAAIASIFIGIQLGGMIGILFCLGLVVMHDILKKVEIL